ncbi:hypothetical protein Halru_0324 [Halovivax ruber XH-70]|uniref:Uncharacterized protein n=1 Tax=Halovivax ruber (strain DSM 18193 / JCM 13892 / XH-70) TaxID=797302 RepID=L0I846_HALRX|nr:hypothetical protein [Halovivax ruber]AGB14968.1 hypothetical protein Halru_0324 [Halovivax ruber XH-70]
MSTVTLSDRGEHLRSIGVTSSSALLGVAAGLLSYMQVGATEAAATNNTALAFVLGAIVLETVVVQLSGIYDDDELGFKLYLFITFLVFSFWFVTWGILLTELSLY